MKKILALVALSLSMTLVPFTASAHGPSPQKVEKTVTIKADPAKVWAIVKDFGNIHAWHPGVASTNTAINPPAVPILDTCSRSVTQYPRPFNSLPSASPASRIL